MTARYVVMPVAEARASGKRAAGVADENMAPRICAILNGTGKPMDLGPSWDRWWTIGPRDTAAIVDTAATAADGSPGESERRPASGWRIHESIGRAVLTVSRILVVSVRCEGLSWSWAVNGSIDGFKPTREAAQLAAEDAAASLLVDALLALGETGREAMRRAMEGRR